jgi:hypothetical protein
LACRFIRLMQQIEHGDLPKMLWWADFQA